MGNGWLTGIPIIGDTINSIINSQTAKKNTQRTIQANKEMAEYAYSKDLEMWHKQNEYNTPELQMERIAKAGLNPNMVYGTGTVTGNTSGQMPKYQAPRQDSNLKGIQMPNMLGLFQDMKMKSAQIDNISAATKLSQEQTAHETLKAIKTNHEAFSAGSKSEIDQHLATYSKDYAETRMLQQKQALLKSKAEVKEIATRTNLSSTQGKLRRKELSDWETKGIRPNDRPEIRAIMGILKNWFNLDVGKIMK